MKVEAQDPDAELRGYLAEVLTRKRDGHPSFQLLKVDEIDAHLYPEVEGEAASFCHPTSEEDLYHKVEGEAQEYIQIPAQAHIPADDGSDGKGRCPVWDIIRRSWSDKKNRSVVIIGEGGIGKTVALFSITRSPEGTQVPALYVPMYELVDRDGNVRELSDYIRASYSVHGGSIEKLAVRPWKDQPQLLVLLDGFNEVPYALRRPVMHKINTWYESHIGVQLVAVSRPMDGMNLSQELAGNPIPITLAPLDDTTIREYLRKAGRAPLATPRYGRTSATRCF